MAGITRVLLMLGLCFAPLADGGAQLADVQPGARIRLRAPGELTGRAVGLMVARSADSLTFAREGLAPLTLPVRGITSLEVSRGKSRARGLVRGLALGGAIGLVLGASSYDASSCESFGPCSRGSAGALGAFGGALLGAGIGAAIGVERWEGISLSLRASSWPSGGGHLRADVALR